MKRIYLVVIFNLLTYLVYAQNEAYYINLVNEIKFRGQTEVKVVGGRADIVNEEYAIEVEWADHWKNSIGQALWYALQTNKKPGIVVLMRSLNDSEVRNLTFSVVKPLDSSPLSNSLSPMSGISIVI